jgi:hypothetical protein
LSRDSDSERDDLPLLFIGRAAETSTVSKKSKRDLALDLIGPERLIDLLALGSNKICSGVITGSIDDIHSLDSRI